MKSNNKVKSIIKDFNSGKTENAFLEIANLIKDNPKICKKFLLINP